MTDRTSSPSLLPEAMVALVPAALPQPEAFVNDELAALVRAYQLAFEEGDSAGASRSLDALCRATLGEVCRFCAFIAGPRVNPMDAAQEAMIEACRKLPSLRDPTVFRAWLYSIARNKVIAQRRWGWVRRWVPGASLETTVDPSVGPYREVRVGRRARLVEEVLEALPEEQRTALVLHLLQGLSDSEVAACLDRKKTNIKSLIRRAKENFRKVARKMGHERELAETLGEDEEG